MCGNIIWKLFQCCHYMILKERRKSLETQVYKMMLMEKREFQLKEQLKEKSDQVKQLAGKILVRLHHLYIYVKASYHIV